MSEVADRLLAAIRDTQPNDTPSTRLATVTGGTSTTVTVTFDGEAIASPRGYVKTYAGASVGDRVVMLQVGSTWVAVARIAAPILSTTPGNFSGNIASNASVVYKDGATVSLFVSFVVGASAQAANSGTLLVPATYAPPQNAYGWLVDAATGGAVAAYVDTGGLLKFIASRAAGAQTFGVLTYVTTAA